MATRRRVTRPEDVGIGRLFWVIRDAVIVGDAASGRIVLWSPSAEAMFGFSAAEAVGQSIEMLVPPELRKAHRTGLAHFCATGQGHFVETGTPFEVPALRHSGERFWIELSLNPVEGPSAGSRYVLAVIRDVTARRLAESERRERERAEALAAERSAILDQITEGVIITDAAGRITFVNAAARHLHGQAELGVPVERHAATYGLRTLDGQLYPTEELPLARAVRHAETVRHARWRIDRPDGTHVIAEGSAGPVVAADGTRLGSVLVLRDVTQQAALEQDKDDFLAAVTHDLKNPLASVRAAAQLLSRLAAQPGGIAPDPLQQRLASIEQATRRMNGLLDELMDATQLGMDRPLQLDLEPTDLVALARSAVAEQQAASDRHRIRLEADQPQLIGLWDATRLGRVLGNLLENAVKYSPAGGEVQVRVTREGSWAVVRVIDQGLGIPAADLPHIFERFRRAGNVVGQMPGTGLGLAVVRQIVEQLGGTVSVESQPGQGSTFTVRLPHAPAD